MTHNSEQHYRKATVISGEFRLPRALDKVPAAA